MNSLRRPKALSPSGECCQGIDQTRGTGALKTLIVLLLSDPSGQLAHGHTHQVDLLK